MQGDDEGSNDDGISGVYTFVVSNSFAPEDTTEATVILNDDNSMTID